MRTWGSQQGCSSEPAAVRTFPDVGENVQAFSDCPDANARYTIFDDELFDPGQRVLSLTGDRGAE